jgi:hypothetical protein
VPCLGGLDLIIGTKALAQLEAELNFQKKNLKFKSKSVLVKMARNTVIRPGESKTIIIKAKLPELLKSSEVYFQPSKFFSKFLPSLTLIKMFKHTSKLSIHNSSRKYLRLDHTKPMGCILLSHFLRVPTPLDLNTDDPIKNTQMKFLI